MTQDEHILSIHYYFPPIRSGGVLRNYFVAKEFADRFLRCHVITTSNQRRLPSEKLSFPSNLTSYPVSTFDFRTFFSGGSQAHINEEKKSSSFVQLLVRIQKSFPFNLFIGEGGLIYILASYIRARKLIKENDIKIVYSSAFPYADHIVAYLLKRKFKHLKWVADFRDLQIEPIYNNVVFPKFQAWCERFILKKADLVTSVSQGLIDKLKRYQRPVHVMPRGVTLRNSETKFEKFTISYTGSLYKHFRDPSLVYQTISEMLNEGLVDENSFRIIYAGRDGGQMKSYATKNNVETLFEDHGFVLREESLTIQNRSHINLMLTSSSREMKGVITGKIFEYLEANNLILVLINGEVDEEISSFIHSVNAGEVIASNEQDAKEKVKRYISASFKEWQKTRILTSQLDKEKIKNEMSWSYQVDKMLSKID